MCIFYKNKFHDFFGKWTFINVQFLKPQPFIEKIKNLHFENKTRR
jgi:hypothetical protein